MQHTYKEGEDYVFMDMETYEEGRLSAAQIGERVKYLKGRYGSQCSSLG